MNEKTKAILQFDPFEHVESLLDKRHEDWNIQQEGISALDVLIKHNQEKREYLRSIGDTYSRILWVEFIEIVKSYDFKIGYCQKFTSPCCCLEGVKDEEVIFFHEEKGLILYAESYDGKYLNDATLYGEVKFGNKLEKNQCEALADCFYVIQGKNPIPFNVSVIEGFRYRLDILSEAFEFYKSWTKVPYLRFVNSMDTSIPNYNYKEITRQKIDASAPEVRKIIFG